MWTTLTLSCAVLALVGVAQVAAQVPGIGKCPDVKTMQTLNVTQYLGTWYEVEKFPAYFEPGNCVQAQYSMKDNGHIKVVNSQMKDGKRDYLEGDAYIPDVKEPGKLQVKFYDWQPYGNYWVVDTDYKQHTVIYSCTSVAGLVRVEFAWILARTPTLPPKVIADLKAVLKSNGVDVSRFVHTDQTSAECAV